MSKIRDVRGMRAYGKRYRYDDYERRDNRREDEYIMMRTSKDKMSRACRCTGSMEDMR